MAYSTHPARSTRLSVFGYDLTYAHGDYVMSAGRVVNVLPSTVVRIATQAGSRGSARRLPLGRTYLPGFGEGARGCAPRARASADRRRRREPGGATWPTDATLRGHEYAKSAIDVACWDILGRVANLQAAPLACWRPICRSTSRSRSVHPTTCVVRRARTCGRDRRLPAQARRHARAGPRSRGGRPRRDRA